MNFREFLNQMQVLTELRRDALIKIHEQFDLSDERQAFAAKDVVRQLKLLDQCLAFIATHKRLFLLGDK